MTLRAMLCRAVWRVWVWCLGEVLAGLQCFFGSGGKEGLGVAGWVGEGGRRGAGPVRRCCCCSSVLGRL